MINYVEMTNWRAYDYRKVAFEPGITFLMGANGIGKTSILEAIAYGLTGEPSTLKDRGKLLRDPDQSANVRMSFTVDNHEYIVERTQSRRRAEGATLTLAQAGKPLASSNKHVTAKIEDLMGVSQDFLQRIVYMAEGDVFRFLDQPPGNALDLQIRRVLGLTQLDEFTKAVDRAEKEIKARVADLQTLLKRLEEIDVKSGQDLEDHLRDIDGRRENLLAHLRAAQERIAGHRREHDNLLRVAPLMDRALPALKPEPATWEAAQRTPVLRLFDQLDQAAQEASVRVKEYQVALARLEGEQIAYQRILDLMLPYADRSETLPCPVCGKPMTRDERERIVQDVRDSVRRADQEQQALRQQLVDSDAAQGRLQNQVENLRELRNALAHVRFQSLRSEASLAELQATIASQRERFQADIGELHEQENRMEQAIAQLEEEKAEYLAMQRRLQMMGYSSPEAASQALVELEVRALSLRAASNATQETLARQRNVDMSAIYAQIAGVWQTFAGRDGWQIQLDKKGNPTLDDGQGHQFDLSQFSGGEKTALLVMLHTIIAHHFSQSDFLLIDEPLEHLDPVNRRSLIRFLVGAYRRRSFQQAIIATFEESLIRKYMSEEGVNVIHLS